MKARGVLSTVAVLCECAAVRAGARDGEERRAQNGGPGVCEKEAEAALARASARVLHIRPATGPGIFPVKPGPLRPDAPSSVRVRGLPRAVFAIGPDEVSLVWLASNAERLRAANARGVLVSAASAEVLRRTRAHAVRFGLALDPMPGAALATAFGAVSYPFVAEPSA